MEEAVEVIIMEPCDADEELVRAIAGNPAFKVTAVVDREGTSAAAWLEDRGVERSSDLAGTTRLLPGSVIVYLGRGLPGAQVIDRAAAHGLSLLSREAADKLASKPIAQRRGPSTRDVVGRYRKLIEDYFPTSRNSSTAVKLAACLTEVMTIWDAEGGAILSCITPDTLTLTTGQGITLPRDTRMRLDPASALFKSAGRGKHEVLNEFPGELLPGVRARSAMCLAVKSGALVYGVLVLWSSQHEAFTEEDLGVCSLFSSYITLIHEVDDLGERLGQNLVTDALTGLHNRRQFDTRLRQEVMRAQRYTLNLSLIVFDVDRLDAYNEACGQMLGNLALSDIASILGKGTREVDFLARVGDDEFAIILPETNRLGAVRLADRLRHEISSYPFPVSQDQPSMNLTVSAGISNHPSASGEDGNLLAAALSALQQAKERGGDSITLWEEGGGPGA